VGPSGILDLAEAVTHLVEAGVSPSEELIIVFWCQAYLHQVAGRIWKTTWEKLEKWSTLTFTRMVLLFVNLKAMMTWSGPSKTWMTQNSNLMKMKLVISPLDVILNIKDQEVVLLEEDHVVEVEQGHVHHHPEVEVAHLDVRAAEVAADLVKYKQHYSKPIINFVKY